VESLAISLIAQLRAIDRTSLAAKPVVFLAHVFSGVILKQSLIELANSGQTEMFMPKTVGSCIFLEVPRNYTGPSTFASLVGKSRFKHLLAELDTRPNYLAELDRVVTGIARTQNISIRSGYEDSDDCCAPSQPILSAKCWR
jgi:hypothetical protein